MGHSVIPRCPLCDSDTPMPPHQLRLNRCTNRRDRDFYSWRCTDCDTPVAKYASVHAVALLTAAGVPSILYLLPLEMDDQQRTSGVLSADDVLDFALALAHWDGEVQWQS